MTRKECEEKAHQALAMGLIEPEQLQAYIDYLWEKYGDETS